MQETAIFHAMDVFGHLALAAARRALVHQDQLILVRSDDGDRGAVVGRPALVLASIEQHGVDAFLCAWARIEVVGVDLLMRGSAVMHHHLLAAKVGMAERTARQTKHRR